MTPYSLKRILSSLAWPVGLGGYLFLLHYGWQKLQYSPIVNGGGEPATLTLSKFKNAFLGKGDDKKGDDKKGDDKKGDDKK